MTTFKLTIKEPNAKALALLNLIRETEEVELKEEEITIPQWQQDEVQKRKEYLDKHPESAINFDDAMTALKAKYDL